MPNQKITKLIQLRDCAVFEREVYGKISILEELTKRLDDPIHEWSADDLMWIHFKKDAQILQAMLDNTQLMAEHQSNNFPPFHKAMVDAAQELVIILTELHTVRESLITPHLRPDGKDIEMADLAVEGVGITNLKDRAVLHGLTPAQQAAYESQLTQRGHIKLSITERATLSTAIKSKL